MNEKGAFTTKKYWKIFRKIILVYNRMNSVLATADKLLVIRSPLLN